MASQPSSSTSADPAAPPPRSSWVILGSIPRVVQGGGVGAEAADLSLALAAPPRVSRLTVSQRIFPDLPKAKNFPFALAADPSGLLLLSAILAAPLTRVDIDRPGNQSLAWRDSDPRYFLLDATTGSAFRLPDPRPKETILHQGLLGVVACPGGGRRYVVAELVPMFGIKMADLRCFSSDLGEWVIKSVQYPLPPRPLSPICTLAHHGRLWWVDYSWVIITADPFADDPVLRFVPLPRPWLLEYREAHGVLDKFRYVGVSSGKLRFVDTYCRGPVPNKITVWTLPNPDATEWTLEYEATFADIWADDSYKATGLPKKYLCSFVILHRERANKDFGKRFARLLKVSATARLASKFGAARARRLRGRFLRPICNIVVVSTALVTTAAPAKTNGSTHTHAQRNKIAEIAWLQNSEGKGIMDL